MPIIRTSRPGMFWPFKRLHYYDKNIRNILYSLKANQPDDNDLRTLDSIPVAVDSINTPLLNGHDKANQNAEPIKQKLELSDSKTLNTTYDTISKIKDLGALFGFVDHDLTPLWKRFSTAGEECQTVRFEELWFVFRPGDICFAPVSNTLCATMKSKASSIVRNPIAQTLASPQRYQETWRVLCTSQGRPRLEPTEYSDGADLKINPFKIRVTISILMAPNFFQCSMTSKSVHLKARYLFRL